MATVDEIKKWMKSNRVSREELGAKTMSSKKTVDGWLSTGKTIPDKKLALIERLMSGDEELSLPLPPDFEDYIRAEAERLKKTIDEFVIDILAKAASRSQTKKEAQVEAPLAALPPMPPPAFLAYTAEVIGNIAAGSLSEGDTIPYAINIPRPLEKEEYILRVNGKSMEPEIMDGALVIVRHHTIPPIPKPGTIVVYTDERGYTLKRLVQRKTIEGKKEYILKALNPAYPDITPMDGGRIPAIYIETITNHRKA